MGRRGELVARSARPSSLHATRWLLPAIGLHLKRNVLWRTALAAPSPFRKGHRFSLRAMSGPPCVSRPSSCQ